MSDPPRARRPARTPPPPARERAARPGRLAIGASAPATAPWARPAAWTVAAAFAAVAIAIAAGPHRVGDVFTETDFYGGYGPGARLVQHGHLDPSRYGVVGPVYELVLAAAGFVVRDLFVAAEAISIAAAVAALLLWRQIVAARAGALPALVATLLLATHGQFLHYAYSATTDSLALGLEAAALAALLAGGARGTRPLLAGVLSGLAFLTRYTLVVLLPAGLVTLLAGWTGGPVRRRRDAMLFAAGFLVPAGAWIAYSLASGAQFHFQLHHNVAYEVFARSRGISWDAYANTMQPQFPTPWSVLARDPGRVVAHMAGNVFDHLRRDAGALAGPAFALAAVAGLALGARDGALARLRPVWLAAGLVFLALVPAFYSERYSLALLPAWAALAALAFTSPRFALALDAGGGRRVWLAPLLAAVVLVPAAVDSRRVQERALAQLPHEAAQLARATRALLTPADRVIARKPHFAFYAGVQPVAFPYADSLPQLAAAARAQGARWIYFSWPEAEMRPRFVWMLDTTAHVPGLLPRAVSANGLAVLYEIGPDFGRVPGWLADGRERALHAARATIAFDRTDVVARMRVAVDFQDRHRWADAQPLLDDAARLAPGNADVQFARASNLLALGRTREAGEAFALLDALVPGDPRTRIGQGWSALLARDASRAAALWRPVVTVAADPVTLDRMAEVFTAVGDAGSLAIARDRRREFEATP